MDIELTNNPEPADLKVVTEGMRAYELSVFPNLPDESEDLTVAAFVRDRGGVVCGGIKANIYWDGVEIDVLWIADGMRRQGLASKLMRAIEDAAKAKGAVVSFLKTFNARIFYESLGYTVFGVLEDRPIGTKLYYMKKRLDT